MSRGQTELDRAALIAALNDEAGRKSSTATILYQQAIAERLGLSLTDLVAGEILSRTGSITAGELAELSGLTTGAITGVVDRLEKVGFVRRVSDPNDRRRVMLEPQHARFDTLSGDPYAALEKRFNALYAEYDDAELGLLVEFLRKSILIFDEETLRLRDNSAQSDVTAPEATNKPHGEPNIHARMAAQAGMQENIRRGAGDEALIHVRRGRHKETRTFTAPRGNFEMARLKWDSGPVKLFLRGSSDMPELYRAEFRHDIPIVRHNDETVSVQYRHRTLFGRGGGSASVDLNAATAWMIYFECGASHLDADLRALRLKSFWLKSNTSRLELRLPPPQGTVPIHLESGLSSLHILRPKQVPVRLEFDGEGAQLRFDRQKMSMSSEGRESPNYQSATDRYLIRFVGGGSKIVVD